MIRSETLAQALFVFLITCLLLLAGFYVGYRHGHKPVPGHVLQLLNEIDQHQLAIDSLEQLAQSWRDEAIFWQVQVDVTNELLERNADSLQAFYSQQNQRDAQRNKMLGAGAAELDSFFGARYPR